MVEVPVKLYVEKLLKKARESARPLASVDSRLKTDALNAMAERLLLKAEDILEANRQDVETAGKAQEGEGARERLREAVDRISLTDEDIQGIADELRGIADLPDPVGEITGMWMEPNGMQVSRVRSPIGVIAVICDLGPRASVESAALCLKSGNVCIIRTNPEWKQTDQLIFSLLQDAAVEAGLPAGTITFVERTEREAALELLRQPKLIDAIIPRGGGNLRKIVTDQARMPVLCNDGGISYVYVDADADLPQAQNIVSNSKAQWTAATNAVDTVLVHQRIARSLLPGLVRRLLDDYKIEVRGCPETMDLTGTYELSSYKSTIPAKDDDWRQQFQSAVIAVKVVEHIEEALDHIAGHGPCHTAAIVTRDYATAIRFSQEVDASAVTINASTRLNDGHEFGLGGQIGISTGRVHARGPLSLEELTCQKFVVFGTGQLKEPHPIPTPYEDAIMLKKQ